MTSPAKNARLPLLDAREAELETCGYCPKLCRATCPVSDALPSESVTPWGKMSAAWAMQRGARQDRDTGALAWACSGCFRCRTRCDHENPVPETLTDARAASVALGLAPPAVERVRESGARIRAEHAARLAELRHAPGVSAGAGTALVLGCRYVRKLPQAARDALRVVTALAGPVRLVDGCCGAFLRAAGDPRAADGARRELVEGLRGSERAVVVDPGCALELAPHAEVTTLAALAAERLDRLRPAPAADLRYHDSCALGRRLGQYREPRAALERVFGAAPSELEEREARALCSGGGALLPVTMPEVAGDIARRLGAEHARLGGGSLVTGCAASSTWLRRAGVAVLDFPSALARGLGDPR